MPFRKPRVLRKKNIRRKRGARAQSKQIMALSRQVRRITRTQFETVMTGWIRPKATIDLAAGGTNCYICPLPTTPGNPTSQMTGFGTTDPLKWSDNRGISSANYFTKSILFGVSSAARASPEWFHTGTTLKYRMQTNEPSFSTYSMFVIQARPKQADQLSDDRGLKASSGSGFTGSGAQLQPGTDYVTHPEIMGTMINRKYWKVLYQRVINFSVPNVTDFKAVNVDLQGGADTRNNTVLKEGTFRIPAAGSIKNFNNLPFNNPSSPALGRDPPNASQLGYQDEDNAKPAYLVIVNNGVSTDGEITELSLQAVDRYKAVV